MALCQHSPMPGVPPPPGPMGSLATPQNGRNWVSLWVD